MKNNYVSNFKRKSILKSAQMFALCSFAEIEFEEINLEFLRANNQVILHLKMFVAML